MKTRSKQRDHSGSSFDSFLEQEEFGRGGGCRNQAGTGVATEKGHAETAKDEAGIDDVPPGGVTWAEQLRKLWMKYRNRYTGSQKEREAILKGLGL